MRKPRVMIYVQDSWGLGHIQRVSKLSKHLQQDADCVILCGHREAGWIVSELVEYVRIPSFNIPLTVHSEEFWGRKSHISIPAEEALQFRRSLIMESIRNFKPDVFIVENRPLGMSNELKDILPHTGAVNIFLTRGIMTSHEEVGKYFLSEEPLRALESDLFQQIIVACDKKAWDFVAEYKLSDTIACKVSYVGYISEPVTEQQIQDVRKERGLSDTQKWLVCSAGGGAMGEKLIQECIAACSEIKDTAIDIVVGPHSTLPWPAFQKIAIDSGNIRLHKECRSLPQLHAAADLVVCAGGYNSLTEVMEGGAPAITISVQNNLNGEQQVLADRLSAFYPITRVGNYNLIKDALMGALTQKLSKQSIRATGALNFSGNEGTRQVILSKYQHG